MIRRRTALNLALGLPLAGVLTPGAAQTQARKDTLVLAMTLEPPGLDPTAGAAAAIAEVVQYNLLETLTRIQSDSSIAPLLAQRWTVTPDNKTWPPSRWAPGPSSWRAGPRAATWCWRAGTTTAMPRRWRCAA